MKWEWRSLAADCSVCYVEITSLYYNDDDDKDNHNDNSSMKICLLN